MGNEGANKDETAAAYNLRVTKVQDLEDEASSRAKQAWDGIKPLFRDLYVDQKLTLEATSERLAREHAFEAT